MPPPFSMQSSVKSGEITPTQNDVMALNCNYMSPLGGSYMKGSWGFATSYEFIIISKLKQSLKNHKGL